MTLPRLLITFAALTTFTFAVDAKKLEGEITGVVCAACQEHVTTALMKVEGVKSVEFKPTNDPEVRHITLTTTNVTFSASDANNALAAAKATTYKVTKLEAK
jgi:copper chaperone CopZ